MKRVFQLAVVAIGFMGVLNSCRNNDDMMSSPKNQSQNIITFENVADVKKYVQSGIFEGEDNGLILPGKSVQIKFNAGKGQRLMFTTMFGKSKDWFFASKQPGIKLYDDNGKAITGDVSSQLSLWDNGTKNDTTGEKEDNVITTLRNRVDVSTLMKLELSYDEKKSEFTLTLTNTTKGKTDKNGVDFETPFSKGVWAVANVVDGKLLDEKPFFVATQKTTSEMTALSETGNPEPLNNKIKSQTGIITGLSPALVVVYQGDKNPIYQLNQKDAGMGLKNLAQMGDANKLKEALTKIKGVKYVYVAGNSPVAPGQKMQVNYQAANGDKIAYATMFGYSNDWFYSNEKEIVINNTKGDITSNTILLDSGTGVDQYPGAGNKQALFGGTSEAESKAIAKVGNQFPVPAVSKVIKVTLK